MIHTKPTRLKALYNVRDYLYVGGGYLKKGKCKNETGVMQHFLQSAFHLQFVSSSTACPWSQIKDFLLKLLNPPVISRLGDLKGRTLVCSCPYASSLSHASFLSDLVRMNAEGHAQSRKLILTELEGYPCTECKGDIRRRITNRCCSSMEKITFIQFTV